MECEAHATCTCGSGNETAVCCKPETACTCGGGEAAADAPTEPTADSPVIE